MATNGAGQGLLADDWDVAPLDVSSPSPVPADTDVHQPTGPGLIMPDGVRLLLDTALHGDRAVAGTPAADGWPRPKNLAVLVGTLRVSRTARGRERRLITELGAAEYRYELNINEIVGDEHSALRTSYRLPITMSEVVRARVDHLLQDGQRIAIVGPLGMEARYDRRFQRDELDAGRRTWDVRIDVFGVEEAANDLSDMAWVQLEGEVVERPRLYVRRYGDRPNLVDYYAGVTIRQRDLLPAGYGRAVRPVVRTVPVEVLINPDEEIIPGSDALLRAGNRVHIEGRLNPSSFRLPRSSQGDATVQAALARARAQVEARTDREHDTQALERQVARAQERLLTERRLRVEVGYVELLHGSAASVEERQALIAEAGRRPRSRRERSDKAVQPSVSDLTSMQDADTARMMQASLDPDDQEAPTDSEPSPAGTPSGRPRRIRTASHQSDEPHQEA